MVEDVREEYRRNSVRAFVDETMVAKREEIKRFLEAMMGDPFTLSTPTDNKLLSHTEEFKTSKSLSKPS
ncbi:hypothetical protein L1887_22803 [Cichorium endivia]|nr:hypothetical protein L1887_22803 [Cichorium endivia]